MPCWRPDATKQGIDHAELVMDAAKGMSRSKEIVRPHQSVPLIVQQADQLIKLSSGQRVQARPGHGAVCRGGYLAGRRIFLAADAVAAEAKCPVQELVPLGD